ncbi:MAG: 5-formyltetrahydrofolate cyclo-ligase [Myxococcales bacterium]|jgi:5-formyltetrahydrofolate cyclo-ligase|nr:5-formyltetrahydrofolate cyclo-ligase [Myxococcales bacterium]MBL0196517.1 5-formyltetrahydrofolate cyclo-ligase [Myxococcales bacterium]HQY60657.1 5-formyltetrahydrofolate cyclo-ligase [Polyangiaceae bacterium]
MNERERAGGSGGSRPGLYADEVIAVKVKAELRKRMRGLRRAAPAGACEARSQKIRERLLSLPRVDAARSIALFFPIEGRNEVSLVPLDAVLRARGVAIGYPAIDPESRVMCFRTVPNVDALEERGFGFREPGPEHPRLEAPDVVVVPALAVAPSGHRLGYGAGYYDRALAESGAWTVAVLYDYQVLADLPTLPHDVPVAYVVTDARAFEPDLDADVGADPAT